jgi:hypothetical protein
MLEKPSLSDLTQFSHLLSNKNKQTLLMNEEKQVLQSLKVEKMLLIP